MISLFVDTSYKSLYLAILKNNDLIDEIQLMSEFNFSELMLPSLEQLLNKNKVCVNDIKRIYVVVGPGSFTGIRIGLTACKILAYSLRIPIVPISSLEFMATTSVDTKYIVPLIDARHNMVFGGVYDQKRNCIIADKYSTIDELIENLNESFSFVTYDENLVKSYIYPKYDVSMIARKHCNDNGMSCHAIKPNYLKKTEAEEKIND